MVGHPRSAGRPCVARASYGPGLADRSASAPSIASVNQDPTPPLWSYSAGRRCARLRGVGGARVRRLIVVLVVLAGSVAATATARSITRRRVRLPVSLSTWRAGDGRDSGAAWRPLESDRRRRRVPRRAAGDSASDSRMGIPIAAPGFGYGPRASRQSAGSSRPHTPSRSSSSTPPGTHHNDGGGAAGTVRGGTVIDLQAITRDHSRGLPGATVPEPPGPECEVIVTPGCPAGRGMARGTSRTSGVAASDQGRQRCTEEPRRR